MPYVRETIKVEFKLNVHNKTVSCLLQSPPLRVILNKKRTKYLLWTPKYYAVRNGSFIKGKDCVNEDDESRRNKFRCEFMSNVFGNVQKAYMDFHSFKVFAFHNFAFTNSELKHQVFILKKLKDTNIELVTAEKFMEQFYSLRIICYYHNSFNTFYSPEFKC